MNRTRLVIAPIAVVFSLALASTASADTFCVHQPAGCVGTPENSLNEALLATQSNGAGTRDTIQIGAGTFVDLPATIDVGNPVDIVGDSAGSTVLRSNTSSVSAMKLLEPSSTASQLQIQIAGAGSEVGLLLAGEADHVRITTAGAQTTVDGVRFHGMTGKLRHSSVSLGHTANEIARAVAAPSGTEGTIEDSSVSAASGVTSTGGYIDVRRSRVWAQRAVVSSDNGYVHLSDSTVQVPARYYSTQNKHALSVGGNGSPVIVGERITVYGDSAPNSIGVFMSPADVAGNHAYVTLENSVLTGFADDAYVHGGTNAASTFTTRYSAYRFGDALPNIGGVHNTLSDVNLTGVDPGFGAEGPVPLRAGSPLIDAGDPAYQLPGTIDLYQQARIRDGDGIGGARVDIGAFEYQRVAPVVTADATPDTVDVGTPVSFTGTATDADLNDELTYKWTFDDGGAASADGADAQHSFASPGPHSATLTVTDSAGVSATATAVVTVNAPAAPPSSTPTDTAPGSDATTPPVTTPKVAPRLTGLRLSRTTFRARGARTSAASRSIRIGTTARFSTSEPARVTLTIQRRKGGRWVTVGHIVRQRGAGTSRVRFDGRIKRRPLAAGRYRIRAVARDADGMSSAARVARFRIAA